MFNEQYKSYTVLWTIKSYKLSEYRLEETLLRQETK